MEYAKIGILLLLTGCTYASQTIIQADGKNVVLPLRPFSTIQGKDIHMIVNCALTQPILQLNQKQEERNEKVNVICCFISSSVS